MISEKKEAASITPAAKPSRTLWVCCPGRLTNSMGAAPTAVIMPAARLPRAPAAIGERDSIIRLPVAVDTARDKPEQSALEKPSCPRAAARPPRSDSATSAASALKAARRVVVKIGSSLLIDAETRRPTRDWLAAVASDLAALKAEGREVIVVSSGSIALGRGRLPKLGARLEDKQAAASVGQSLLMAAWSEALAPHDLVVGQVLLTRDDTERRRRWLNARATVEALLGHGVIPVVNENDTVATEEIRYGDNDRLAARTAQLARADLLILLSDVDGLYTADPRRDPTAAHLPLIETAEPGHPGHGRGRQHPGRRRHGRHGDQAGGGPDRPLGRVRHHHRLGTDPVAAQRHPGGRPRHPDHRP